MIKAILIKLGILSKAPIFTKKLSYAEVFSASDWNYSREVGLYLVRDGKGYWMKDLEHQSDISCWDARPSWGTHVAWYDN